MPFDINIDDLLRYTAWQRAAWAESCKAQGNLPLKISVGANGDGRFGCIADLIRHIFSAEKRYVDRLMERELTDTAGISTDDADSLFHFGRESRRWMLNLIDNYPSLQWGVPQTIVLMNKKLCLTPRDLVLHVVLHEIRHWAQIATLVRMNGHSVPWQDFLFYATTSSPTKANRNMEEHREINK